MVAQDRNTDEEHGDKSSNEFNVNLGIYKDYRVYNTLITQSLIIGGALEEKIRETI